MLNKMILEIDNLGAINHSIIDMNQINIIGGVNSSGKSTSSKLLYSFLTSVSPKGAFLANKSINERLLPLMLILRNTFSDDSPNYLKLNSLINAMDSRNSKEIFTDFLEIYENSDIDASLSQDLQKIKKIIEINESEDKYAYIMNVLLSSEFKLNNIADSRIRFHGNISNNSFDYELNLSENKLKGVLNKGSLDLLVFDEVIYLDSLSILDSYKNISSFDYSNIPFHIQDLLKELKSKGRLDVYGEEFSKNTKKLKEDLEDLIGGKIEFDSSMDEFIYKSDSNRYSMTNTASGIKQMGILQLLIEKNIIKNNSFLFVDEPEVNLHPEWQIKFAEFIVVLAKNSNISFYINSHSPFFIEAIEVYSDFYDILDRTSFYLSSKVDGGFNIEKIDVEELDIVYKNLGDPFNVLNRTRFLNEMRRENF